MPKSHQEVLDLERRAKALRKGAEDFAENSKRTIKELEEKVKGLLREIKARHSAASKAESALTSARKTRVDSRNKGR